MRRISPHHHVCHLCMISYCFPRSDIIDDAFCSGFEDDGGLQSEGGPASTDCGQNHTAGDNTSVITDHSSATSLS